VLFLVAAEDSTENSHLAVQIYPTAEITADRAARKTIKLPVLIPISDFWCFSSSIEEIPTIAAPATRANRSVKNNLPQKSAITPPVHYSDEILPRPRCC